MKYIQFAIMPVLVFGIAASPVLSNGFAFADHTYYPNPGEQCTPEDRAENHCYEDGPEEPRDSDKESDKESEKESEYECTAEKRSEGCPESEQEN